MEKAEFRRIFMPYCIKQLSDGRYIVLNRRYKPLGTLSDDFVDYDAHPSVVRLSGMTAAKARAMSARGEESIESIFFYNDGCIPTASAVHWRAYSARLQVLAGLTVEG